MLAEARRQGAPAATLPSLLAEYARRVERLSPSPRFPNRFHEEKSEIVAALLQLAWETRRG
jgi:hypothetical protein